MNTTKRIYKRLVKNAQAVSPIIATLMLVLVAVGSAGAFYVWQSGWQSDVQEKTGGAGDLKASMTIGGSTTVYPFTAVATQLFEQQNPNYKIAFQQGGSGAGVAAVGIGTIDVGASSSRLTTEEKAKYPDMNRDGTKDLGVELVETLVAYDAVVIVVPEANTHGLINISKSDLKQIYECNGGKTGTYSLDTIAPIGTITWDELNTSTTSGTKCTGNVTIKIYDRAEISGTEETFVSMMGFSKKDSLESNGIQAEHKTGNPELLQAIAADPDALGFMSYGFAKATGSGVKMIPYRQTSGTIDPNHTDFAKNVKNSVKAFYDGARELLYITVGEPKNDVKVYIDFVSGPEVNKNICSLAGYISLY